MHTKGVMMMNLAVQMIMEELCVVLMHHGGFGKSHCHYFTIIIINDDSYRLLLAMCIVGGTAFAVCIYCCVMKYISKARYSNHYFMYSLKC